MRRTDILKMTNETAINLAQDALREQIKRKRSTAYFPDKRAIVELRVLELEKAIDVLEGLKK